MVDTSASLGSPTPLLFEANIDIGPHFAFPRLKQARLTSTALTIVDTVPLVIPLNSIESIELKRWWLSERVIELRYLDGVSRKLRFAASGRLMMDRRTTQEFFQSIEAARQGTSVVEPLPGKFPTRLAPAYVQTLSRMQKEIASWGMWMMVIGAISLALNGYLDSTWGIVLLLLGLLSFKVHEPAMLIVYGVTLLWAAVMNVTSAQARWTGTAAAQVVLALTVFSRYPRYHKAFQQYVTAAQEEGQPAPISPYAARFAVASMLLGLGTLVALGVLIVVIAVNSVARGTDIGPIADKLIDLDFNVAAAAFAFGLAALLRGRCSRLQSVVGMASALATIAIFVVLSLAG